MLRQRGEQQIEEVNHKLMDIESQCGNMYTNEKEQSGLFNLVAYGMKWGGESQGENARNKNLTQPRTRLRAAA